MYLALFVVSILFVLFAAGNLAGSIIWCCSFIKLQSGIDKFLDFFSPCFEDKPHDHDKDSMTIHEVHDIHNYHNGTGQVQADCEDKDRLNTV
jgi:hypothetical protein